MRYIVIKEYTEAPVNPISLRKAEVLEFLEESDPKGDWPHWLLCRGRDKEGWIPRQILQIRNTNVICMSDYTAREHNLIPDEILISERSLNGWIWGYKEDDPAHTAWAPLNCLQPLKRQ